jgi:serine/threonine protein kinase
VTPDCELDPAPEDPTEPFEEPSDAVAIMVGPTPARSVAEGPGSRIGPYRLLQQLGEGGMGVVYMAEQATLDRRRVA